MELIVGLRDKSVVETSGGKVVCSLVKSVLVEDLARLFSDCLLQVVIVHSDARHMTLVSRNNARLLANRGLKSKDVYIVKSEITLADMSFVEVL